MTYTEIKKEHEARSINSFPQDGDARVSVARSHKQRLKDVAVPLSNVEDFASAVISEGLCITRVMDRFDRPADGVAMIKVKFEKKGSVEQEAQPQEKTATFGLTMQEIREKVRRIADK